MHGGDFEQAYEEHVGRIYAFFAYQLGSPADAEDLTQQTFERALRSWERFDPARGPVVAWLFTIARNLLTDRYRGTRGLQRQVTLEEVDPGALPIEDRPREPGLDPELARAISGLQHRDQEILALRYGGDLTGPEIASLTGLSLANVQQILSRSLRELRRALESKPTATPPASRPRPVSASPAPRRID